MGPLPSPPDDLEAFLRQAALPGWRVVYVREVGSTQDLARAAAQRGDPDRSVFVADYQTAGRGRRGRAWIVPPGAGLLFSVLFRTPPGGPPRYTLAASVAVCEAIERLLGLQPAIKWPNDVLVGDRKVVGVLAEGVTVGEAGYTIVGIGVNVNFSAEALAAIPANATALNVESGAPVPRGELLRLMLERLSEWVDLARSDELWRAWRRRLWGRGRQVLVAEGGEQIEGTVLDALEDGWLLVRLPSGETRRVIAGELVL